MLVKRGILIGCWLGLTSLGSVARAADVPATQPAPLSPQLVQAIGQLTADDYQDRQAAMGKIQAALAQGIREMVLLDDPEARNRMVGIMEYNAALSRWAIDALALPREQRIALAKWAMTPQVAPLIANVYGSRPEQRAAGMKDLGTNADANASLLLAHLIRDEDRSVRLAAMEAVRERPATPAVIDALWSVASGAAGPATSMGPQLRVAGGGRVVFGGAALASTVNYGSRMPDENTAIDVLIHLKDPGIPEKIRAYFADSAKTTPRGAGMSLVFGNDPMRGILALAAAYQVKQAVPPLMKIVNSPVSGTSTFNFNGHPTCITNRTAALATVCQISGQKPEDYKLRKSAELNQWCTPDAPAETQAADKLTQWYQNHRAEYEPATQPAPRP